MSKEMAVIALGFWVVLVPYLGVPGSWRTVILILTGMGLVALGFFLRSETIVRGRGGSAESFVEHVPPAVSHEHKEGINSLN